MGVLNYPTRIIVAHFLTFACSPVSALPFQDRPTTYTSLLPRSSIFTASLHLAAMSYSQHRVNDILRRLEENKSSHDTMKVCVTFREHHHKCPDPASSPNARLLSNHADMFRDPCHPLA